jgi:hypothetical protein
MNSFWALCITLSLTTRLGAVLTKITKLSTHQSSIWLVTNIDTHQPDRAERETNHRQIISLTDALGLTSVRRAPETHPLVTETRTVVIYQNPFKFQRFDPSTTGFVTLIAALPFHSGCRGIDIEKRERFINTISCLKDQTLTHKSTVQDLLDEYELLERPLLAALETTRGFESVIQKEFSKARAKITICREKTTDCTTLHLHQLARLPCRDVFQEALRQAFNLLLILEIYHAILLVDGANRKIVFATNNQVEYLKRLLIATGHQERQVLGDGVSTLSTYALQVFAPPGSRRYQEHKERAAAPSNESGACCTPCVLI